MDLDLDRLAAFLDPTSSVAQVRFVVGYQFLATDAPQSWAAVFYEAADTKLPIDLAAFHRASGEKPVFESRASLESDESNVDKNALRISTVIEIGKVPYLCDETPCVRRSALMK